MSDSSHSTTSARTEAWARGAALPGNLVAELSRFDRLPPVWILAAMAVGLGLGRAVPSLNDALSKVEVGGVSLPIGLGLLSVMYPVLAKVGYDRVGTVTSDRRLMASSLLLNWIVGPALMFALAWVFLPDLPEYRTGLIIVGLARASPWSSSGTTSPAVTGKPLPFSSRLTQSSRSSRSACWAGSTSTSCPGLGLDSSDLHFSVSKIVVNVLIFLGIPLLAGYVSRRIGERTNGREW